ncbi:MAG: hypothetical protein ACYCR3_11385 [Acidithiobacillus sp.]
MSKIKEAVLDAVRQNGQISVSKLTPILGADRQQINVALWALKNEGRIERVDRGIYTRGARGHEPLPGRGFRGTQAAASGRRPDVLDLMPRPGSANEI